LLTFIIVWLHQAIAGKSSSGLCSAAILFRFEREFFHTLGFNFCFAFRLLPDDSIRANRQ